MAPDLNACQSEVGLCLLFIHWEGLAWPRQDCGAAGSACVYYRSLPPPRHSRTPPSPVDISPSSWKTHNRHREGSIHYRVDGWLLIVQ